MFRAIVTTPPAAREPLCYATQPEGPMSIDAEEAAIRTVILGALRGDPEAGDRNFDALSAMRQAETIVRALKMCGYEIRKISR
jgi:hypothetical protein